MSRKRKRPNTKLQLSPSSDASDSAVTPPAYASANPLTTNSAAKGLTISVPATAPDAVASVIALTLNGQVQPIENAAAASAK